MKSSSFKINFILTGFLLIFCFACSNATSPVKSPNPWKDNYSEISGMENYKSWGTYNVHDPACLRIGDTYYMYSTDAIYFDFKNRPTGEKPKIPMGNIQVRTSKDLVHWNFEGWAFPEIPQEAKDWVLTHSDNKGATNIWAPFIVQYKDKFRLYYCVSAFGLQTSYIGLAESASPLGPWELKGSVVKTQRGDKMNAIDPSIITNAENGKMWMHYGSYFGGLYAVELNPETGFTMTADDQGHSIARRANLKKDNIEAPEITYNPTFKKYYHFSSYDPLMTTYNVRVGRADKPEGPFLDFFGNDLRDTINHYPILTHPYQFKNHPGWAGTAHCGIFANENGDFFMVHQSRLSPDNQLMVLHVREVKWTADGWPVVSPERYAASKQTKILKKDIEGTWEIIRIQDSKTDRKLEFGQIMRGENRLRTTEIDVSNIVVFCKDGKMKGSDGKWKFDAGKGLTLILKDETINNLIIFVGHDWENETETLLFTGLDQNGCSVWGKKIK
ncbi:MAG: arabinan endo-1,5-alpha-L-arabinosidase [Bacteroidales bacterium]|nr:arabinan endo-1,5-alpha-L-arabinosidase [Bacteroidales bacterium]